MKRSLLALSIVTLWAAWATAEPAGVGDLPDEIDLPAYLALVRERSPRFEAERETVDLARAEQRKAGAYPNPTLGYGHLVPGGGARTIFEGDRQQDVSLEIPLLVAGQFHKRIAAANVGVDLAKERLAVDRAAIEADAGIRFFEALAAEAQASSLARARDELERMREVVTKREPAGLASRYDVARVEVELAAFAARKDGAEADLAGKRAALGALADVESWRPRAVGGLAPLSARHDVQGLTEIAPADTPAVRVSSEEEELASANASLARRERWPVPSLTLGRTWTDGPYGGANFVGVVTEILLTDRKTGAVMERDAEKRAAGLRRRAVEIEVRSDLLRLGDLLEIQRGTLARFDRDVTDRLPALREMAAGSYRLQRGSVLELLDALRSAAELEIARSELVLEIVRTEIAVLASTGRLDWLTR
jgi:cobalt-zinc-cadmium efflux system outer membrane protein